MGAFFILIYRPRQSTLSPYAMLLEKRALPFAPPVGSNRSYPDKNHNVPLHAKVAGAAPPSAADRRQYGAGEFWLVDKTSQGK